MSTNLPQNLPDLINWCITHADVWKTAPTVIGLTAAEATEFERVAGDLANRSKDAQAARDASKAATGTLNDTVTLARANASILIAKIKNFAASTNDPNVYNLAQISPDSPRSTPPPPVPPTSFVANVNPDGSLKLRWKAAQPAGVTGVTYQVLRRVNPVPATPFTQIGTTGSNKTFVDQTLPLGVDRVDYIVRPVRSTGQVGDQSNIFSLQFGSIGGPGGGFSITNATESPAKNVKIAA